MSIQVSAVPEQTGLSNAAQLRVTFFEHILGLARQSRSDIAWLQELSDRAQNLLQEQSFPTTRDEEWRFTDLSDLVPLRFQAPGKPQDLATAIQDWTLPEAAQSRLVFVDGVYAPEWSAVEQLPTGLMVGNLSAHPEWQAQLQSRLAAQTGGEEIFTALNTVGLKDGAIALIPKNAQVEPPIHLLFISTSSDTAIFSQPRCLVVAEPNSCVTLIEEYVGLGEGTSFTNAVTEIFIEDNAEVRHTRLQRESVAAYHIGKTAVSQGRNARYTCNAISLGALLSRHHLNIYSNGEQTETTLNGLTMLGNQQLGDLHSAIALSKPHCTTRQLQKNIVGDRAHVVFNGKVFVPKLAQLTDAGQLNRNLLLSRKARVDTKPQLEIVADNVKCTHGATVGQLDNDEVFYLQSRGIDAESARRLLVYAFAYEILSAIPVASLQTRLLEHTRAWGVG